MIMSLRISLRLSAAYLTFSLMSRSDWLSGGYVEQHVEERPHRSEDVLAHDEDQVDHVLDRKVSYERVLVFEAESLDRLDELLEEDVGPLELAGDDADGDLGDSREPK
jgi:transposase